MPAHLQPLRLAGDLERRKHGEALARLIAGEVRFDKHDRMLYATDASIYQIEPIGVVIPKHLDDVRRMVEYCRDHSLPLLPRGGGTSLAGQCVNHAVVMDMSAHLAGLAWVDAGRRTCGVQPGITIDDLNDRLKERGLFFAPDPATSRQCNIGGAIGNNAAGTRSILFGRTSDNVEAVSVMLMNGESHEFTEGSCATNAAARSLGLGIIDLCTRHERLIRERFPKTIRRNAGYALDMTLADIDEARRRGIDPLETLNLAQLICGSEGTLAVVTGATLKLHPIPKAKGLAVIGFESLEAAIECVVPILALRPSAVELLDDTIIDLARNNIACRPFVDLMPRPGGLEARPTDSLKAVLYVEFFADAGTIGTGREEIEARFSDLRSQMANVGSSIGFAAYTDAESMTSALKLRKAGEPLLHGIPGRRKPLGFVEDNAVPAERLGEFVREFKRILASHGTRAAFWAHASVGVLHVRPLLDLRDPADRDHMERIAVEVADLARSLGGVMSGEHGDGRARGPLLERYFGPELMRAFREVKRLFDPINLLNPGIIVEPGPIESIHEATRVRPTGFDVGAAPIDTYFDYEAEHGLDHAVELCNGSGVCRKKQGGTMCPSYMATLDERHSTRGRGNALRLAITGQFKGEAHGLDRAGAPGWADRETLETLDLCLSCKACKSECPSNVDIAKYKAEYLAQSYRAAGRVPLKARVFGNVRGLNRVGSAFAPLSNWIANSALARVVVNPMLGLAPKRTLPTWERSLFRSEPAAHARDLPRDAPVVILFADCFTAYNESEIGLAAIRLLNAFGYRVVVPRAACCGRAAISTGLLDGAKRSATAAARTLMDAMERHKAAGVVACEPSCLSAVKDDWLRLKLGVSGDALERLARRSFLVEEFLGARWDEAPRRPRFNVPDSTVALHAHCHQKALWGEGTSARLLRRIAGERLRVLDAGCCGMAGSFGYAAHRFDLSMKIGELALFPAVRGLRPDDVVVAPGTSCRHQIRDGASREALHPVLYAERVLGNVEF
jgi:FAD/FMN-containing dehydrogenase/Fe-S oxidoreductase